MINIIDFHTHVLPGMDDGSKSVEMSMEMLRREAAQGIRQVIATPHFYPWREHPEQFLERRDQAAANLQNAMEMHDGLQVTNSILIWSELVNSHLSSSVLLLPTLVLSLS